MNDKLNNNVTIIPPFKRFCMTIGELPSSYTESMTYYESLVWLCNYMQNTLIPAINNNGEAVTELQEKFVELKNYVDTYFENLDVQEEINNKLDEMAEQGELAEIIAAYLEVASVLGFDTKSALKGAENLISGSIARTLGTDTYDDGFGYIYKIRDLEESDVIDDDNLVALTNYPALVAEKLTNAGAIGEVAITTIQDNGLFTFDTLSDMQDSLDLTNGSICKTLGTSTYNDGLGHFYKVRSIGVSETPDGNDVVALDVSASLVAERINDPYVVNVKNYGAKGDGTTNDSDAITAAINDIKTTGGTVFFPKGTYIILSQITLPSNVTIKGIKGESIIKASSSWDSTNTSLAFDSMIKLEYTPMEYSSNTTTNVAIKDITINNNGQSHAGKDGVIQFRGLRYGVIDNVTINVAGNNCWGAIIFSSNKHITINNVQIFNNSADNSLGGCLWIRSGLNVTNEDMKTYDVNVTNSYFESTAKDELICIADGVAGGWTEANIENCTLYGKASTTYASFLIVANSLSNTSYVKALLNNINLKGSVRNYAVVAGYEGINSNTVDLVANNLNINMDNGGGVRSYDYDKFIYNNCNITLQTSSVCARGVTLTNSYCNKVVSFCNIIGCIIDNPLGRGCEDCYMIANSIIKAGTQGVHTYGATTCNVINNKIYADDYAIHFQNNGDVGCYNCTVSNNYMQRLTESDNTGSVAIFAPYANHSSFSSNRTLVKTGASAGTSIGFNTWSNMAYNTECITPEALTVTYVD